MGDEEDHMTLRVTVEIVPFGEEDQKYEIGRLHISNYGPTNELDGNYWYHVHEAPMDKPIKHYRDDGAWVLIQKAINKHVDRLTKYQ